MSKNHTRYLGTKRCYFGIVKTMVNHLYDIKEQYPDTKDAVNDILMGLQFINNEYVFKRHPEYMVDMDQKAYYKLITGKLRD